MKPVLFCSILIAFFVFSCKPKPLDNLKHVARQAEENKVKRVSRAQLAQETARVADSLLLGVMHEARQRILTGHAKSELSCVFSEYPAYQRFRAKYRARVTLAATALEVQQLHAEIAEYRKFNNQLPENRPGFPAAFQTQTDTILLVREVAKHEQLCDTIPAATGFWAFRFPKQKLVEIMTVKVKPKPAKGPNW